eukprot:2526439-Amphidinium_carterae.4
MVHKIKYKIGVLVKPKYTELVTLKMPNGRTMQLMKGTQYVDGFWRILRSKLGGAHRSTDANICKRVRFAQWTQWVSSEDEWTQWSAFGALLCESM